ncbi:MAG: filamentous hemagglutinin N-terminal protein, partial [Caulobacteraceae bacterium]|nr:filamentous hemagglutinin N-terminal protein [Caulobacteraceae bacterium]
LLAFASALAVAHPAAAQVATNIAPDVAAGFATGTNVTRAGAVTTIAGGVRAGANLFHSFATFDLGAGDLARWTAADPAGVANIVNRVTGGAFSTIAGTIDTTAIPNANFYFVNPAGVLFGATARVNVSNAAYFSTAAGGVTFADGAKFSATAANGSTFSMTPPQSFGFLGNEGNIIISGAAPAFTAPTTSLSLTAANVGVQSSTIAPYRFDLVTTGGQAATIAVADPLAGAPLAGLAILNNAQIGTLATGKGFPSVRVAAGSFALNVGGLTSSTFFSGDAGDISIKANSVEVAGAISSSVGQNVTDGMGGTVRIQAGSLHVGHDGLILSSTFGAGDAGSVLLAADDLTVDSNGIIASDATTLSAAGRAGTVQISATNLTVSGDGSISAGTTGYGDAGSVIIDAGAMLVDGRGAVFSVNANGFGSAGSVTVNADDLHLSNGGQINSSTFNDRAAGDVSITAQSLLIEGKSSIRSESNGGGGNAGGVRIDASTIVIRSGGEIASNTDGAGDAGAIAIHAGSLLIDGGDVDSSTFEGSGRGGQVTVDAGALDIRNKGFIAAASTSDGDAGTVQITAGQMSLSTGASVSSISALGSGAAGDVTITASGLTVTDSSITTTTTTGKPAGDVSVTARDLSVNGSIISSDTFGAGAAGGVTVKATNLTVTNDSFISSTTFDAGAGGQVSITADKALFDFSSVKSRAEEGSSGAAGTVLITVPDLQVTNQTEIASATLGAGNAGLVSITAQKMTVTGGSDIISSAVEGSTGRAGQVAIHTGTLGLDGRSIISSDTFAAGDAGGVVISAAKLTLANGSSIESGAGTGSSGDGGTVDITATDSLILGSASLIVTSTLSSGDAGQLTISGGQISLDGSALESRAFGPATGAAGGVSITASSLQLTGNGQIGTSSSNPNPAGDVTIASTGLVSLVGDRSQITSENLSAAGGAAGSISISGAPILVAESGFISTNSTAGPAGDITMLIPNGSYLELVGHDAPGVITTSSGPGTGGRIIISNPTAVISNGGQILALGELNGANVQIRSDYFIRSADRVNRLAVAGVLVLDSQVSDVSAGVAIPDVSFLDASGVLRGQCPAARSGGITSQLSLRPFGPYALDLAPAATSDLHPASVARGGGCSE